MRPGPSRALAMVLLASALAGVTASAAPAPTTVRVRLDDAPALGDPRAPVTLVEFSDFRCPFCRRFARDVLPTLRREYIDRGVLRLVHRDLPLRGEIRGVEQVAAAARCAGEQGQFWEMRQRLFTDRRESGSAEVKRLARALPLNHADFDACVDDGSYVHAVRADAEYGASLGVIATPTYFIGRSDSSGTIDARPIVGAPSIEQLRREIAAHLE